MRLGEPGEFALFIGLGGTLITLLVGPIGQAIAQRVRGGKPAGPQPGLTTGEMTGERIAALEDRIADLESERVLLEERLDFAERLLAQSAEQRALGSGDARRA